MTINQDYPDRQFDRELDLGIFMNQEDAMSETNDAPLAESDASEGLCPPESGETEMMGTRITTADGGDRWIPHNPRIDHCVDMDEQRMYFPVAHDGGDAEFALTRENCEVRIDMTEDYIVLGIEVVFP